ncbi:hypothetical protein [Polymorphospora rubra]|uniref:YtkA-like domain-containing protein n=1 Tax=Polymorphospora rubra TaxID=338584 RepID=A0A810N4E8_9ACTN|nr:hypothetical protein [Polymorphospora rubra]BCJ67810.1 hypothetical protein Prubr_48310 [Polymorphospora rubra]
MPDTRTPSPARLVRWITVVTASIIATLACWQDPGYARDDLRLTITHDGRGTVRLDVARAGGGPPDGEIAATVRARGFAGGTVDPRPMRPTAAGSLLFDGTLPQGQWTVDIEVTVDGARSPDGSCAATLTVGPDAPAESVVCAGEPLVTTPAGTARGRGLADSRPLAVTAGAVGLLFAAAMGGALLRRRATEH